MLCVVVVFVLPMVNPMAPLPWGKHVCRSWQKQLCGLQAPTEKLCHPVAQLCWTPWRPEEALDWDGLNSAAMVFAIEDFEWPEALALAREYETRSEHLTTRVFAAKDGRRTVADTGALLTVVASALLDRDILCEVVSDGAGVEVDETKLWIRGACPKRSSATLASLKRLGGPHIDLPADGMVDPKTLANTRTRETPCWPKVYHFAKLMEMETSDDATKLQRTFGPVFVHCAGSRFTSGSRHRPTAALLAGRHVFAEKVTKSKRRYLDRSLPILLFPHN